MELTFEQITVIGILASVLGTVIRYAITKFNVEIGKSVITIIVAVLSVLLAFLWLLPSLPVFDPNNPLIFVGDLLQQSVAIVGMATIIYNLFISKVIYRIDPNMMKVQKDMPKQSQ